jgi:hypothetical protein
VSLWETVLVELQADGSSGLTASKFGAKDLYGVIARPTEVQGLLLYVGRGA